MKIGGLVGNGLSPSNEKAMASVSLLVRASTGRGRSPLHSPHMVHPSQLPGAHLLGGRQSDERQSHEQEAYHPGFHEHCGAGEWQMRPIAKSLN